MRKRSLLAITPLAIALLAAGCATIPAGPSGGGSAGGAYGLTVDEEAQVLALEDRREYDPVLTAKWVANPNPLHRLRIALALGRIGPHTFIDGDQDGNFDEPIEYRAGVKELLSLAGDSDRRVREMVAFSLGEIGDTHGIEPLFKLAGDSDASVAAEAVEALSKLAKSADFATQNLGRYLWLLDDAQPEGVRERATRYLFRFDRDDASRAAIKALASTSSVIRQAGAYALSRRPLEPAREPLELLMTDPNPMTRAYATTALGKIGSASSAPLIVAALQDEHPWVRTNAAVALARILENAPEVARIEDLPRILAATEDPDPGVRAAMVDTLGYYAEKNATARDRLRKILDDGSQWERELAAGAVMKHVKNPAWIPPDPTPWMLVRAIEGSQDAAWRRQFRNHPSAMVRAAVLSSIADEDVDSEWGVITAGLEDPDVIVRANAIDRYGKSKNVKEEKKVETLQAIELRERASPMDDARLAAIAVLSDLKFDGRRDYLRSLIGKLEMVEGDWAPAWVPTEPDLVVRQVTAQLIVDRGAGKMPRYTPLPTGRTDEQYREIVRWSRAPHTATIHMTRGPIEIALLTQDAPITTWNFAQLAKKKFYDNTSFMRVVPNFVIQGGDPRNDTYGGPGYAIRDEINLQKYTRGAVGMALSGPDTGGSQFFIAHSPQPHLDGGFTVFGRVYEGMDSVVDQTERGDRVETITIDEHPQPSATPNE